MRIPKRIFDKVDAYKNGKVTSKEIQAFMRNSRLPGDKPNPMKAMILESVGVPFKPNERPDPHPAASETRLKIEACAVRRTDLHVVDGDLLQLPAASTQSE
jgi:hypothetical protein